MILILGSTHDDVLYYETLLTQKHYQRLFGKYPVTFGRLFNQDICLVSEVYTNYISSLVTSYFIDKYFIILVICVGTCLGYSEDILPYDIALSNRVMLSDVDQVGVRPVSIGQIPNDYPTYFPSDEALKSIIQRALNSNTTTRYSLTTYYSSNTFYTRDAQIQPLLVNQKLTPLDKGVVFDCTYGGVALSCYLNHVSSVAIKVVETKFTRQINYEDYAKVLEILSLVGRAVASSIGDISSRDILGE